MLYSNFRKITEVQEAATQQQNSVKYTVAVGLKDPLFNGDKRRPKIDRVGPREVGKANGGEGWPWAAAWAAVKDQKHPNRKWGWLCFTGDGSELGLGPKGCQEVGDEVVGRWRPMVVRRRRWSEMTPRLQWVRGG